MIYLLHLAALFAAQLLFSLLAAPREIEARVIGIADGDTIAVSLESRQANAGPTLGNRLPRSHSPSVT